MRDVCQREADASQVRRITWIGLVLNIALTGFKFVVGYIGASQAIIADAFHSLSDMVTDVAVLLGVRFWANPPDREHPYGHWRIETLVTTIIGLALAAVALGIGYEALAGIRDPHLRQPHWIAITGAAISIVVKEILYRYTVEVGRRVKSGAVVANAWHHRSDALSSIPAMIAVSLAVLNPKLAFVDHLGAFVVSLFILKVSWDITKPALDNLVDRGATAQEVAAIRAIVLGVQGVQSTHAIRSRRMGPGVFLDLHVLVDGQISVKQGHDIAERIKKELMETGPDVADVVVHVEPVEDAVSTDDGP